MYKNRSQGFTLIELLVVIAIIGILSAVVLASLNTARSKGQDAAIQSNMSAIATSAELYYGSHGNKYSNGTTVSGTTLATCATVLWADPTVQKALAASDNANGAGTVACYSTDLAYAVSAQMVTDTGKYWCVDSSGTAKQSDSAVVGVTCPIP